MKRLLLLVTLTLGGSVFAGPQYLGRITAAASSVTNHTTAVPFYNVHPNTLGGKRLLVQCDAAMDVLPVKTASGAVTAITGFELAADEKYEIEMAEDEKWLAIIGTGNCDVWVFTTQRR